MIGTVALNPSVELVLNPGAAGEHSRERGQRDFTGAVRADHHASRPRDQSHQVYLRLLLVRC